MLGLLFVACLAILSGVCAEEPTSGLAEEVEVLKNLVMQQAAQIESLQRSSSVNLTSIVQPDTVEQLQQAVGNHTDEIQKLGAELSELIESKFFGDASRKRMLEYHDKCAFSNHGYCFFAYFDLDGVSQTGGRLACEQRGAELANIYSKEHYNQAVDYLRQFLAATIDTLSYVDTRTGMTFDAKTGVSHLSTGETAPFIQWLPNRPTHYIDYKYIYLAVTKVQDSNGMADLPETGPTEAALCQILI